jgi:starch phosphorylase
MVREYVESGYVPAARMVAVATGNDYRGARSLSQYRTKLGISWNRVKIFDSELVIEAQDSMVVGREVLVKARIDLAGLEPSDVDVQAVVGKVDDSDELHDVVTMPMDATGIGEFTAKLQLPHAGSLGYTVRVLPRHPMLASPAELAKVVLA